MKTILIAILSLFTAALTLPLQAAQEREKSLYERLGGVFAIATVVDHFSDAVVQNPIVGKTSKNPAKGAVRGRSLLFITSLLMTSASFQRVCTR